MNIGMKLFFTGIITLYGWAIWASDPSLAVVLWIIFVIVTWTRD